MLATGAAAPDWLRDCGLALDARGFVEVGATLQSTSYPDPDPELGAVAERFAAACAGDDVEALARLLHPEVEGWATLDGERVGYGAGVETLAVRTLFFLGPRSGWRLAPLPLEDGIALLATRAGEPVAVVRLDIRDGLVDALHSVLLPAALPER